MYNFSQFFLPKCSSGYGDCYFDNPVENFMDKIRKNSTVFHYIKKSQEMFIWTLRSDFWGHQLSTPSNIFLHKDQMKFYKVSDIFQKIAKIFLWARRNEFLEYHFLVNFVPTVLRMDLLAPLSDYGFLESFSHLIFELFLTVDRKYGSAALFLNDALYCTISGIV